jgi:hypothetical protein
MPMRAGRNLVVVLMVIAFSARACWAGMPSFSLADVPRIRTLADLARMRLEVISFFLLALLIFAGILQAIWNGLRKDFTRLPRLSYFRALGVIGLWGLLFLLVLTMISGARELMTPGAWEKVGATYRLAPEPTPIEKEIAERYEAICQLKRALWKARANGQFPAQSKIAQSLWIVPRTNGARYEYIGGATYSDDDDSLRPLPELLAVEPAAVGDDRLAISRRRGEIRWVPGSEVAALSEARQR